MDKTRAEKIIRNATDILNRETGENPYLLHEHLQEIMQENVGIVRTEEDLTKGINKLNELKSACKNIKASGSSQFNPGWHEALALRNLMITSEAVAIAALMREESRGAHTRLDFSGEKDDWLNYNVVIKKSEDEQMKAQRIERHSPDKELERVANLTIEGLEKEVTEKA